LWSSIFIWRWMVSSVMPSASSFLPKEISPTLFLLHPTGVVSFV
jgi:hypothetical protein